MSNPLSLAKTALAPSLKQTVHQNLPMALVYTTLGIALKSIGSIFRINDLQNAPQDVQTARMRQEVSNLATAGLVTLAAQSVLPLIFHRLNIRGDMAQNLIRSIMIAPGYIVSESISRWFGDVSWDKMMASHGPKEDTNSRNVLRQLTTFLFQPNAPHNPTQAFGQIAYNPYNRVTPAAAAVGTPSPSPLSYTPAMVGHRLKIDSSPGVLTAGPENNRPTNPLAPVSQATAPILATRPSAALRNPLQV